MKRFFPVICLVSLAFFFMTGKARAQDEMQKWMDYMTPSDIHKLMAGWDGEWTEEIEMWMDPNAPAQQMKAACVNKMILGGRYQESKHTGEFNGMPFEGISTLAWDNARKVFISTWIDNFGTGMMYMEGGWDAATQSVNLKGQMTDPVTGKLTDVREVLKVVDANTQVMEQYATKDGKEFKTMHIRFTRKK